jgi:multiple sugar transport system permease protein
MATTSAYNRDDRTFPYIAIMPVALIVLLLGAVPAGYTFLLSLQRYELINPPAVYIGMKNFVTLLTDDPRFVHAAMFTICFALVATSLELVIGFFTAHLLADREVSHFFSSTIRTLLLVPFVVAPVVASYTFKTLIYDQTFGYLNNVLKLVGIPGVDLFHGSIAAPIGILVMELILRTPFIAIILYAAISSIEGAIFDASRIDGVSWVQNITRVIIPVIRPIIVIGCILRFMDALKMFDEIYVVTAGGPGYVTENLSIFATTQAFTYFHMGYAAASAFLFLLVVVILVAMFMRRIRL